MTRVKFFEGDDLQKLEVEVNDFISTVSSKATIQTKTYERGKIYGYSGVMEVEVRYVITVTYEEAV